MLKIPAEAANPVPATAVIKSAILSFLVIFLYGSMFWGLFPQQNKISWEGHLSGFIAGIIIAFLYKNQGPKRKKYQWEIDEELENLQQQKENINI